jgi:high-affinity nickel-transport protein
MLQKGKSPLGVGFFFSLGHATLCSRWRSASRSPPRQSRRAAAAAEYRRDRRSERFRHFSVDHRHPQSDRAARHPEDLADQAKSGNHSHAHLEELLLQRGLINRLFGGRLHRLMNHSWQMYPLGLLFGLGFDTASEVGLLAMTAGASAGNLPLPAVLSLPVLFAAGMCVMDTTDGVLMVKAYNWAFLNPLRKIFYNITTTGLSVVVALLIGTVELLQVFIHMGRLTGGFFDFVAGLDFGMLGYVIVALFLLAWGMSVAVWKFGHIEQRYAAQLGPHVHVHRHNSGTEHSHDHRH